VGGVARLEGLEAALDGGELLGVVAVGDGGDAARPLLLHLLVDGADDAPLLVALLLLHLRGRSSGTMGSDSSGRQRRDGGMRAEWARLEHSRSCVRHARSKKQRMQGCMHCIALHACHLDEGRLGGEVHVVGGVAVEAPLGADGLVREKLVEDVVVALAVGDLDDARALEQVCSRGRYGGKGGEEGSTS
tara:strand:- start:150 stop:716 length:567 start_codon:yes stop_codon:yes gene_type:complete